MTGAVSDLTGEAGPVHVLNAQARSPLILICEHASNFIPPEFDGLGLSEAARTSHAAWDPGALAVADGLSRRLNAPLIAGGVSRLVYDCNRPPDAPDAVRAKSEVFDVPGNQNLDAAAFSRRVRDFYLPFRDAIAQAMSQVPEPVLVTIHSFTPVYLGQPRDLDIGVLHDADSRLADAMLALAPARTGLRVRRNQPYGPQDGVTHTLKEHAIPGGRLNVMLEIRNDLIATAEQQDRMAGLLSGWIADALARQNVSPSLGGTPC